MTTPPVDLCNLAAQWEAARTSRSAGDTLAPKSLAQSRANSHAAAKQLKEMSASDGIARVRRETQGRGGKAVTVIQGIALNTEDLATLGKQLKALCGSGGTVKDSAIEIQGDHVERVMGELQKRGFKVKRSGG